jgi:general secretion pathway protein L
MLVLGEDGIAALVHENGEDQQVLGHFDLSPAHQRRARDIIGALRAERHIGRVGIRLPAAAALSTEMTLPLAAQANLGQVVSFELDRRTPFKNDEVYHSERVVRRDSATQRLLLELTVVPRALIDEVMGLAADLDLTVDHVEAASADPASAPSGNLLPTQTQPLAARLPGVAVATLAGLAVVLGAIALLIPLYQVHTTAHALALEMAESKRQADESLRLQKAIDGEIQESGFLGTRKRQAPSISELLQTLTRLLPDDTWLTELGVTGSEVQLTGYAASAAAVLGLVDQSKRLAEASFRSPVIQDQKTNREQFNIAARFVPEPAR